MPSTAALAPTCRTCRNPTCNMTNERRGPSAPRPTTTIASLRAETGCCRRRTRSRRPRTWWRRSRYPVTSGDSRRPSSPGVRPSGHRFRPSGVLTPYPEVVTNAPDDALGFVRSCGGDSVVREVRCVCPRKRSGFQTSKNAVVKCAFVVAVATWASSKSDIHNGSPHRRTFRHTTRTQGEKKTGMRSISFATLRACVEMPNARVTFQTDDYGKRFCWEFARVDEGCFWVL